MSVSLRRSGPDIPRKIYSNTSRKRGLLMAEVKIDARPNGPYVITGSIELRDTTGMSCQLRKGPCSVAAVHLINAKRPGSILRTSRSVTAPIQRSVSRLRHRQCPARRRRAERASCFSTNRPDPGKPRSGNGRARIPKIGRILLDLVPDMF
jgi:hypothetical protein